MELKETSIPQLLVNDRHHRPDLLPRGQASIASLIYASAMIVANRRGQVARNTANEREQARIAPLLDI